MYSTIRLTLLLSVAALFASACTNMPGSDQNPAYSSGYNNTSVPPVPEAGPLSNASPQTTRPAPVAPPAAVAAVPVPAAHYNPAVAAHVPVATVPQMTTPAATPVNTQYPVNNQYATNTNSSPYDSYTAGAAPVNNPANPAPVNYAAPASPNNSYTSYGTSNTTPADTYAAAGTGSASYDSYAAGAASSTTNNNNYYTNNSSAGNGGGSAAVQVFASISQAKAERIRQDMQSQGLPAVVDNVGGLYKVRIPYANEGTARASLTKVRHASGEPGAFVTVR